MDEFRMYNMMYEAALNAQLLSLQARYNYYFDTSSMEVEARAVQAQIKAVTEAIRKLNR